MQAARAPEQIASGSGTCSGELLPYRVAAEQPFDDPLHAETCPIAYAGKSAVADIHPSRKRSLCTDRFHGPRVVADDSYRRWDVAIPVTYSAPPSRSHEGLWLAAVTALPPWNGKFRYFGKCGTRSSAPRRLAMRHSNAAAAQHTRASNDRVGFHNSLVYQ